MQSAVVRNAVITGIVQHGRKLGRTIGFPTANLSLRGFLLPKFGVYAAVACLEDGRRLEGAANAGVNPTVGEVDPVLEIFLFDFDEDIYDRVLSVALQSDTCGCSGG